MFQQTDIRGMLAIASSAFLWSLGGLFIKLIDWNSMAIAGLRSLIAAVVILLWLKRPHFTWSFVQITAGMANAATMLLFVFANKTTTAANAILLQYSAPIFTAIFAAWLLKEKPKTEHLIAFPFVAGGMLLFFIDGMGAGSLIGNLAAIASGMTYGLYVVFMRMQKDESPQESNLLSEFITVAVALPLACFLPMPDIITPTAIASILALGVLQIGLAAILFVYGITRVTAVQAALIALIEPIFNPVWVYLSTGEKPGLNALIGGALIVTAVTTASLVSIWKSQTA